MRGRGLILLIFALMLGGVAVFLARDYMESQNQLVVAEKPQLAVTTVVVARNTLYFGNRLEREHVREIAWPAGNVPPGAFKTIDEILDGEEERIVLRRIEANEPIFGAKISGFGGRASLSSRVEKGMRAVTIRVNDVNGVAGFVLPGDRVDVLLTREVTKGNPISDVLLQNVKVLGIDQEASDEKDQPVVAKAVTLEVSPKQSQKLALASRVGSLSLTLRNSSNVAAAPVETIRVQDLKFGEVIRPKKVVKRVRRAKPKPAAPKLDPFASVTIFRGLAQTVEKVTAEAAARLLPPSTDKPKSLLPAELPAKDDAGAAVGATDDTKASSTPEATSNADAPPPPTFRRAPGPVSLVPKISSGEGSDTGG